jgi:hypothetical protein
MNNLKQIYTIPWEKKTKKTNSKENIWVKKEIGESDDKKGLLLGFLNFHALLRNPSSVVHIYQGKGPTVSYDV